jgi:hypothetical protein
MDMAPPSVILSEAKNLRNVRDFSNSQILRSAQNDKEEELRARPGDGVVWEDSFSLIYEVCRFVSTIGLFTDDGGVDTFGVRGR